uniref:CCDC93 coiled-coil domain-containing protein n=1 Tax=Guillardia theta TaxID=55529 RepID=A0A7S4JGW8_GUITH
MTLGQKIMLGENIAAALRSMRCPFPLMSHQIRGLDFSALFPVIQWLVKQVISTREELAEKTRRHASLKFSQAHADSQAGEERERDTSARALRSIKDKYKPKRKYRQRSARKEQPEHMHVQCVLLEYGQALPQGRGKHAEDETEGDEEAELRENLDEVEGDLEFLSGKRVGALVGMQSEAIQSLTAEYEQHFQMFGGDPERAKQQGKEQAHKRAVAALTKQISVAKTKCNARKSAFETLAQEVKETQATLQQQKAATERVSSELEKLKAVETPENKKDIAMLEGLVNQNESLKEQEEAFREHCKGSKQELLYRLKELDEGRGLPQDELERLVKVEGLYQSETEKLHKISELLARKTQQVHVLRRKIDDVASRAELVQYERRFVELYEQIASNLEETRRFYNKYNSLTDCSKFQHKEISILNSISSSFSSVAASESRKADFSQQLQVIKNGVQDNLARVQAKLDEATKKRDEEAAKLAKAMERQRIYFKAVKQFQEECQKNEQLASMLQGRQPAGGGREAREVARGSQEEELHAAIPDL